MNKKFKLHSNSTTTLLPQGYETFNIEHKHLRYYLHVVCIYLLLIFNQFRECYVLVTFVHPSVTQIANMLTKLGQW